MASSGGWCWGGPCCSRGRCGGSMRCGPRAPPASVQLLRREAVLAQELEQPAVAHQVQRAHDHEGVAVLAQQLLDLRQPALVAHRHERAIERGKGAKLAREEAGECRGVAAGPGVQHLLELLLRSLQLAHRLVEEAHLILARERLEAAKLLAEGLEACGRLAVGVGAPYELLLDALLGVEALVQKLEIGELDADRPRRLAVEELDRRAANRPHGARGVSAQAAEQAEREEPSRCCATHTTSVSSEPSGRSSSVR